MKILVVCYEYPPVGGGGGRMAHNVAAVLARRGHEIRVQTARVGSLPTIEIRDGVQIHRRFAFRRQPDRCTVPEMAGYLATGLLPSLRHLRNWQPDVIHAHFAVPSGALALACRLLTGVPYVLTAHLGDLPGGNPEQTAGWFRILNPFIRPIWRRAHGASASSSFAVTLAQKAYGRTPRLIPNGIDMGGRPATPRPPSQPLRLVAVGRFQPQKNFPWMIEALGGCEGDWRLDLIGDGEQRESIRAKIAASGLERRVKLHGWLPEETMRSILAGADVFLMPSLSEGNPVAAIEALKQGLAILGSDIPGLSDLILPGENGRVVGLESFAAFRAAVADFSAAPDAVLAMKQRSLELSGQFDIERIAVEFEELLAGTAGDTGR